MADGGRTFTETEHFALLTDAVARETASKADRIGELEASVSTLTAEKAAVEADKSELESRIDVLEAEKVSAQRAHDEAVEEFEAFKRDLDEKAAVQERKSARVAAVQEVAAGLLDDSYFTDARVQRWAEMSDEAFEQTVADFKELAEKAPKKDTAASGDSAPTEAARETAAFTGGTSPADAGGSVLGQYFTASGRVPTGVLSN